MKPLTFVRRRNKVDSFLHDWKEGNIVARLEEHAQEEYPEGGKMYESWAASLARSAAAYHSSGRWERALHKVEASSAEVRIGIFDAHETFLQRCILEEVGRIDLSGELELALYRNIPVYETTKSRRISPRDFAEGYYGVGELSLSEKPFSADACTQIARVITYLLPSCMGVFRKKELQVGFRSEGCYVRMPGLFSRRR